MQNANLTAKIAELEAKCKQVQHEKTKRDSQLEDAERNAAKVISELKTQLEEAEEARNRAERARVKINSEVLLCASTQTRGLCLHSMKTSCARCKC